MHYIKLKLKKKVVTLLDPPSEGGRVIPLRRGIKGDEKLLQQYLPHRQRIIL
jgi:hypothetical protein